MRCEATEPTDNTLDLSYEQEGADVGYSYLKAHGFTDQNLGLPTYEDFKQGNIFLTRHCNKGNISEFLESDQISGLVYPNELVHGEEGYDPYSGSDLPTVVWTSISCHERIRNCALC